MGLLDRDTLSEVLNIENIEPESIKMPTVQPVHVERASETEAESDIQFARSNLYNLIEAGNMALQSALDLASQSEQPRAFEVFGSLLKNVADINHQLIDLHDKKKKLTEPEKQEAASVTNNAIFVGSTNDLAKMLKGIV